MERNQLNSNDEESNGFQQSDEKSSSIRLDVHNRRLLLLEEIKEKGLWSINKKELGKRFGVSDVMIGKDITFICKEFKQTLDLDKVFTALHSGYMSNLRAMEKIKLDPEATHAEKVSATNTINNMYKDYTHFLEAYSAKAQVAKETSVAIFDVNAIWDKVRERKKKRIELESST